MATTPKKLIQRLEAADKKLQDVRRHLSRCEPLDSQVMPLLDQIAGVLKSVGSERELIAGTQRAQQLLKDIRASAERANLLLQSAAELTCNSALAKPSIQGSYTPDGELPSLEFGGRMIVHA